MKPDIAELIEEQAETIKDQADRIKTLELILLQHGIDIISEDEFSLGAGLSEEDLKGE